MAVHLTIVHIEEIEQKCLNILGLLIYVYKKRSFSTKWVFLFWEYINEIFKSKKKQLNNRWKIQFILVLNISNVLLIKLKSLFK